MSCVHLKGFNLADFVLRIFTLSQLITAALVALKVKNKNLAVKILVPFLLALGCYVAQPLVIHELPFTISSLLIMGAFTIPFLFWMLCEAIFTDGFQIKAHHYTFLLIFLMLRWIIYWTLHQSAHDAILPTRYLVVIPKILILFCVAMALKKTISDWRDDLVEERRRIRLFFLVILGSEILVVTAVETYLSLQHLDDPPILALIHSIFMFLLGFWFSVRMLSLEAPFLLPAPQRVTVAPSPPEFPLIKKLNALMKDEQFYLEEGLTIGKLAKKLGEPEYRVRLAINQGLGFRNFNFYLNSLRIETAAQMLRSPEFRDDKILAIALQVGYRSLAPFNKAFKESFQMTPSEYRSQHKV